MHDQPGTLGSFSVSLLYAELIDEQGIVGERIVGDFGVAASINNIKIGI